MSPRFRLLCSFLVAVCFVPQLATAEEGATVSGSGTASIKRQPTKLRMSIVLFAKGKTLPEAIEKLKDRRELAGAHVKKLQADVATTKFGETTLAGDEGGRRAVMERMMRGRGGRVPKALDVPVSVTVNCTLTADWPLEYQTSDELLIVSQQLQDKIKEADLCGMKEPKQLTPQERELEEEGGDEEGDDPFDRNEESGQAPPGVPSFAFVAKITQEERSAALAEAFGKAKQQASLMAQAAGMKLGSLLEMEGPSNANFSEDYELYMAYRSRRGLVADTSDDEATSPTPGPVTTPVIVQAKFRAK